MGAGSKMLLDSGEFYINFTSSSVDTDIVLQLDLNTRR